MEQREIKFRAWDKNEKRMFSVKGIDFENRYIEIDKPDGDSSHEEHLMEDMELMQYTGRKDKNGKEIYEGDILADGKKPPQYGKVFWQDEGTNWCVNWRMRDGSWETDQWMSGEVIGNIYENPELIK